MNIDSNSRLQSLKMLMIKRMELQTNKTNLTQKQTAKQLGRSDFKSEKKI